MKPTMTSLGYDKVCNLADFRSLDLNGVIRDVFAHEIKRFGHDFPLGHEYRKHWEVGMTVRSFSDFHILHDNATILGVGAGNEPTIFWLTTRVNRVFATDLYLDSGAWEASANRLMMTDPELFWPSAWNPRRLVVQHMNALQLQYEDESFDGIFSSSAIEHFGNTEDVSRAVSEMFRVLKPGGLLSLSTEFRIRGQPPGLPGILMFSSDELVHTVVGNLDWVPVTPFDFGVSDDTLASSQDFNSAALDVRRHIEQNGAIYFHRLDWHQYPHIVLRDKDLEWTSVHLALRKRGRLTRFLAANLQRGR